jgi:hypothetical protein
MIALVEAYIAKLTSCCNPVVHTKVMNLCLAIHAKSPKTHKLIAANTPLVTECHIRRVSIKNWEQSIKYHSEQQLIEILTKHIELICNRYSDNSMRVALSVGVDATVLVKGFQVLHGACIVVGGAISNDSMVIDSNDKDDINIKKFIVECQDGKQGNLAGEVKIAVVSFQQPPPGVSPYLIMSASPQTINDNNTFTTDIMSICANAAKSIGNVDVLNDTTDGVSCEVT